MRPTISLATPEILSIGRPRANCRGCIPCAFCDLPTNGKPILNFLTDLRGAHAAFDPVRTRENIDGAGAPSRPRKVTTRDAGARFGRLRNPTRSNNTLKDHRM